MIAQPLNPLPAAKREDRKVLKFFIAAGAASVILLWVMHGVFNHLGGIPVRQIRKVLANLKQIETAKQMWARDHAVTGAEQVRLGDLRSYLPPHFSNELSQSVMGERYVINPIGIRPEAVLTRAVGGLHSGATIRFGAAPDPSAFTASPKQQGTADGGQPVRLETNGARAAAASRRSP